MARKTGKSVEYRFNRKAAPGVDDSGNLTGRALAYDSWTMIGSKPWGFREKIAPGVASKSIKDGDVVLLDNHDPAHPISRQSAGTLTLRDGNAGCDWDATPANTSYAQDAVENVRSGNYGGCSFGFEVIKDRWTYNAEDDLDERELLEIKLHEISVCTFPAYGDTSVGLRDSLTAAFEARSAFYEKDMRAKYTADELKSMLAKGQAYKNANGDPSYPIADGEDLANAIRAVGRGGADHDAIRKYIIGRAKALGLSDKIPDTWSADGSISEAKSEDMPEMPETDTGRKHIYLRAQDVQDLAVMIKDAKTKAARQAAIALAKQLKCAKMLPDSWNADGDLIAPPSEAKTLAIQDMRSIHDLARTMRPTLVVNDILEITETYLRPAEVAAAEREAAEREARENESKPVTSTLTREDAQRRLTLAQDRYKTTR